MPVGSAVGTGERQKRPPVPLFVQTNPCTTSQHKSPASKQGASARIQHCLIVTLGRPTTSQSVLGVGQHWNASSQASPGDREHEGSVGALVGTVGGVGCWVGEVGALVGSKVGAVGAKVGGGKIQ